MKKSFLLLGIVSLSAFSLNAEIYNLDLEKSIAIAKEKSLSMLQNKQNVKIAEYELREINSQLKTHINLTLKTPSYSKEIQTFHDSSGVYYKPVNMLDYKGTLTVNQPLITDGEINMVSDLNNSSNYLKKEENAVLSTRLNFSQPLTSLYGYNTIRSSYRLAKLNYDKSTKSLKREELNLIYSVSNSFYNLLSQTKSEELALLNYERQKEAYTIAKNKFDAGLIKEVEALQMEVDLAEAKNNYDLSVIGRSSAMNNLKEIIGINLSDSIIISSEMKYSPVLVDPNKAVELALENRLEIKELEIQIEQGKLNVKSVKSKGMIKTDLNASVGFDGTYGQAMSGSFLNSVKGSYKNMMTGRFNSYGLGFSVTVPILDWGENRARVNIAKANLQQTMYRQEENKRNIEIEVRNLVDELNSSLKRLQLLEKNVQVAEKSFSITRQRFSDGNIDSQSLALERDRLNTAYRSHLSAYINYQLLLADIMRKTFYDFQRESTIN